MLNAGPYYRAKLAYANRLVLQFARAGGETVCLALEVIENHAYDRSRFLRGAVVDEAKIEHEAAVPPAAAAPEAVPLRWLHESRTQFHFLESMRRRTVRQSGCQPRWRSQSMASPSTSATPLLVELGRLSPSLLAGVAAASPDPTLPRLVERFERQFEFAGDEADLAWLLTDQPSLVAHLAAVQPSRDEPPEQAMRLLVELLGLERQGRRHDIVPRRKALRDLCPELYAAYMRTR